MTEPMQTTVPWYGDNLDILRRCIPSASVEMVYLDPPLNSNRDFFSDREIPPRPPLEEIVRDAIADIPEP